MLGWSPDQVWAATAREIDWALDGYAQGRGVKRDDGPMTGDALADLMDRYPD